MVIQITCPQCNNQIDINKWFDNYAKTDNGLYYFKCKGCKEKLGSTLTFMGTVSIWTKKNEIK